MKVALILCLASLLIISKAVQPQQVKNKHSFHKLTKDHLTRQIQDAHSESTTNQPKPSETYEHPHRLADMIKKIFEIIHLEMKTQDPEDHLETVDHEVREDVSVKFKNIANLDQSNQVEVHDPTPQPQCLSQIYQSLSTLYSFGADATAEDINQLEQDYSSLVDITKGLNLFCNEKVITNNSLSQGTNCSTDIQNIADTIDHYKNNEPIDYMNVIQTIQSLWDIKHNFVNDCYQTNTGFYLNQMMQDTQETNLKSQNNCTNMYNEAFNKLYSIYEEAVANETSKILQDYKDLRNIILGINQQCENELHINLLLVDLSKKGDCKENFIELRELIADAQLPGMKELSQLLQNVWSMAYRLLYDCSEFPPSE